MAVPITEFQDCQVIARAFEKGAHHSLTEESVFATLTPQLASMRSMSKATKRTLDQFENSTKKVDLKALSKDSATQGITTTVQGIIAGPAQVNQILEAQAEGDLLGGIFNSECIPCGLRINFSEELNIGMLLSGALDPWYNSLTKYFKESLDNILAMIEMFKNLGKYVDLCAFLKFLTEFTCVPDLQRILSVLSAMLMNIAMELNGIFDFVVMIVGPLMLPFLSMLIDTLHRFLELAIKPLECIINAIQNILSKLDPNVLRQNVGNMQINVGLPSGEGPPLSPGGNPLGFDSRKRTVSFNLNPFSGEQAKKQTVVEQAEKELRALQQSAGRVNSTNPKAVESYRKQENKARDKYRKAAKDRDLSAIGKANQQISKTFSSFKGSLFSLLNILTEAIEAVQQQVSGVEDEFKKLLLQFSGSGSQSIFNLNKKLEIVQLASLIVAMIEALKKQPKCDEGKEVETYLNQLGINKGFKVWTDENGLIHIDENGDDIADAINDVVGGVGSSSTSNSSQNPDPNSNNNEGEDDLSRQKLKSLIDFTGDPLLDSSISRAVDGLTRKTQVTFKCPLQTSVSSAEQVNKWMAELNNE